MANRARNTFQSNCPPSPRDRRGLTLFELIVALALSALIMIAIGIAIDLHLRTLDSRRNQVEEAQLARSVLRMIADDLRNAVQYKAIDFSSVQELSGMDLGGSGDDGFGDVGLGDDLGGGSGDDLGDLLLGDSSGDSGSMDGETSDVVSSVAPPTVPGLYGNQYELQVDVSRLPRVDQYDPSLAADGISMTDIPSDVKTVSYYLLGDSSGDPSAAVTDSTAQTGLVRRQLDRAVTKWATDNGSLERVDTIGDNLAPEVAWLEFSYFDGTEWLVEWDSDENGGLPLAVEIVIGISPANSQTQTATIGLDATATGDISIYRLVVHLPIAEIVEEEELGESELLP